MQPCSDRFQFARVYRFLTAVLICISLAGNALASSDVTVKGAVNKGGKFKGTNPKVFTPTKQISIGAASVTKSHLNLGRSVTITTGSAFAGNGDLTVAADLAKTGKKASTLQLHADRDLILNKPLRSTKVPLPIVLKAGRKILQNAPITTNGGNLTIETVEPFVLGQDLTTGAGQLIVQAGAVESTDARIVTASGVEVASGASLRMRGSVTGNVSVSGTLAPGKLATDGLQVGGNLVVQPAGTVAVNLGSLLKFGKITVKGALTLGGSLQLDCVDGFEDLIATGNTFPILSAASITGTFDGIPDGGRVYLPDELGSLKVTYSATSVTLSDWQPVIVDLTWDPGTVDEGTEVYTNSRIRGRRHYFRVHTENTDIGAWRTRLTPAVEGGEADIYLRRSILPTTAAFDMRSNRVGADGFALNPTQFNAAQDWYILVYADPAKPWSVLSGRAYVQDLGLLPWTDTNGDGVFQIGEVPLPHGSGPKQIYGEGMRFYRATLPSGVAAWSLWLNGSNKSLAVRRTAVPFHSASNLYDRKQNGQMLIVPPILGSGVANYFVSVVGNPGEDVNLDSRIQEVTDIAYDSTVSNVDVPEVPYRVYRVQVPPEQIAWDVSTIPHQGNPNIAIRRGFVPAEKDNDAFSEVGGAVRDSITVVPNFLTDGAWFITVYGTSPYAFTLRNGPPIITPIGFDDQKINDQPERAGWRFYGLSDIQVQLGTFGWILELANQVPGSEIAIRRNAVPSRWRQRKDGLDQIVDTSVVDFASKSGFLERPAHQPDVWYVGIYMPTEPLGAFTLNARAIQPPVLNFDGGTQSFSDVEPGRWKFMRVTVPAGIEGWEVRVRNVTGANPAIAVRRDLLPEVQGQVLGPIHGGWMISRSLTWPTGHQWRGTLDWTAYANDALGVPAPPGAVFATGLPLEPGSYYVGVLNTSTTASTSYTVQSRGIGASQSIPVTPLDFANGEHTITDLPPREGRYFKVTVPPNVPSWEVLLDVTVGDAQLVARRGRIPDFNAIPTHSIYRFDHMGEETRIRKIGHERYVMLPEGFEPFLEPGDYYLTVVGEGVGPTATASGTETSSAVLRSLGPLTVTQLGTATASGINHPVSLVAGQVQAFQFQVGPDTEGLEVRLLDPVGSPIASLSSGALLPAPLVPSHDAVYGIDGGNLVSASSPSLIIASNPPQGTWSVIVHAPPTGDATAILNIVARGPIPLQFDGGTVNIAGQLPFTWQFFTVHVPENAVGWDLRMRNIDGADASLVVRRDLVPTLVQNVPNFLPTTWQPSTGTEWPSEFQWLATIKDWTSYTNESLGVLAPDRLVMAMGRPLQPGLYYAGVFNKSGSPISYTINSSGVGQGLTYPVTTLDYNGGSHSIAALAPREPRYFKVTVPPDSPSWEVVVTPTVGEALLTCRHGGIPDFYSAQDGSIYQDAWGRQVRMKKSGKDRYVLLPDKDQPSIPPGDYYLAVVSEGLNPGVGVVGTGAIDAEITSNGPLAIKQLGTPSENGTEEQVDLEAGQIKAYQVDVPANTQSLEVRLEDPVGNPQISLVAGTKLPKPAMFGSGVRYGWNSGDHGVSHNSILTVGNPVMGKWSILVRGGQPSGSTTFNPSSAKLVVTVLTNQPLAFDGGSIAISGQAPNSWRYFSVQVPEGALGWDVRLRDVVGVSPSVMVRRDDVPFIPPNGSPSNQPGWSPSSSATWPSGHQWLGSVDWTGYLNQFGHAAGPQGLVAAMGRPLEPGTYYIGVFNNRPTATSYTIGSRGIGAGYTYEVTDLPFAGGTGTITDLLPREPKYFKVTIPEATQSWEMTVDTTVGDLQAAVRKDYIPDFGVQTTGSIYTGVGGQLKVRKSGGERYLLLSNVVGDTIPAGDYYIAVVSDGVNPNRTTNVIGTGASSGTITSRGALVVSDLGSATVAGTSENVTLASVQTKAYRLDVPAGTDTLELRLENTVAYPEMAVASGTRLPLPPPLPTYGGVNGGGTSTVAPRILTFINPKVGPWTVMVRAGDAPATDPEPFPDASATLVFRNKPHISLNFDPAQAGNGLSHTDTRQAIDGEQHIYRVTPPATLAGQPVLGWVIRTDLFQGAATVRVFKDLANPAAGFEKPAGTMIVVPPFLTFDQPIYVSVKATGNTHYQISSRAVTLERPVWTMPEAHNQSFGDSGDDALGNPLPGDRGIDLEQGSWHFFAVDVPENNRGLLRTELQGISGNPDLYIREDGVPTTDHLSAGAGGTSLINRTLGGANTSYGNWVPINGRTETRLRPGRWYLGVKAGSASNVRYRLKVSTGNVRELALNAASATVELPNEVTGQVLPDNDWRYYRFTVPLNAPQDWKLSFEQTVGDVVMRVRDSVPPGQRTLNSKNANDISEISTDNKNQGPYENSYDLPAEYTLTTPPLRPGHVYYVGFRSNNSATFTFRSDANTAAITPPPVIDFYTGSVNVNIPAGGSAMYRVIAPADATRFKYSAIHDSVIKVRIEQGTLADVSGTQHFASTGLNSFQNVALSRTSWPWQPGQTYYVRFVNTDTQSRNIQFTMNGKNAQNEDEDNDGMLDAWEIQYFNNLSALPTNDADSDGVNNLNEFIDGTLPTNAASAKYALTLVGRNGSTAANPVLAKYDRGSVVSISSTPTDGYEFLTWVGGPLRFDDWALKATGVVTIPTGGAWTFGVHSGDGVRLLVNGVTVINDNAVHEPRAAFGQISLPAGSYPIELTAYERMSGESLELFAAPGSFTSMQPSFRLVGDVANGGLAVEATVNQVTTPGFFVRQVAQLSGTVSTMAAADALLAATGANRSEISGMASSINFLDYNLYEGFFPNNAHFPLTTGMEDQPMNLAINGTYTMTALHTLPLGVGTDAPGITWDVGGNAPWIAEEDPSASDGVDIAVSGPIGDSQSSVLQATVQGPGTLSFRWRVSSQGGDVLAVHLNGAIQASITGEIAWAQRNVVIPAGTHRVTWIYSKNGIGVAGSDRGWVDQVVFTP